MRLSIVLMSIALAKKRKDDVDENNVMATTTASLPTVVLSPDRVGTSSRNTILPPPVPESNSALGSHYVLPLALLILALDLF